MSILGRFRAVFSPPPVKSKPRERFVLPQEWAAIRQRMEHKPVKVRVYFSVLFLTGARRDELRTMQWGHVDLDAGFWHKFHTKNGKRQMLPLAPEVVALLRELPLRGPFVFPGEK